MNCLNCSNYDHGRGNKKCLKCPQYIDIIKFSFKRTAIKLEIVPDTILEAVPDNKSVSIYDAIRQLPLDLSVPLIACHVLDASQRELAQYLNIPQSTVSRKINIAVDLIKKMTISST